MRGGTRYVEVLKAHFGVTAPDFRLQRPELLSVKFINKLLELAGEENLISI